MTSQQANRYTPTAETRFKTKERKGFKMLYYNTVPHLNSYHSRSKTENTPQIRIQE